MNIWKIIKTLFAEKYHRCHHLYKVIILESGTYTQKQFSSSEVVLIRSGNYNKWLRFNCPNHCGAMIILDLSPNRQPHWNVSLEKNKTISVNPSIINKECGTHFFIHKNDIIWI